MRTETKNKFYPWIFAENNQTWNPWRGRQRDRQWKDNPTHWWNGRLQNEGTYTLASFLSFFLRFTNSFGTSEWVKWIDCSILADIVHTFTAKKVSKDNRWTGYLCRHLQDTNHSTTAQESPKASCSSSGEDSTRKCDWCRQGKADISSDEEFQVSASPFPLSISRNECMVRDWFCVCVTDKRRNSFEHFVQKKYQTQLKLESALPAETSLLCEVPDLWSLLLWLKILWRFHFLSLRLINLELWQQEQCVECP